MKPMQIAATLLLALVLGCLVAGSAAAVADQQDIPPSAEVEPNNTLQTATSIVYGQPMAGVFANCRDVDTYTFQGQTGEELWIDRTTWPNRSTLDLLDARGRVINHADLQEGFYGHWDDRLKVLLPSDGTYYLVHKPDYKPPCGWAYSLKVELQPKRPMLVSFDRAGVIQSIPFTSGDILRYLPTTGTWEMYADLSDLGLTGNVTAIGNLHREYEWSDEQQDWVYVDTVDLSFATSYKLDGLGAVQPGDFVRYHFFSTGEDTVGTAARIFDGSDVGLATTGERIDSLSYYTLYDASGNAVGSVLISLNGRGSVPSGLGAMTIQDEDVVGFQAGYYDNGLGQNTTGAWQSYLDGSRYGLGAGDVIGASASLYAFEWGYWPERGNYVRTLWLTFDRAMTLGGMRFDLGDIALCLDSPFDHRTPCQSVTKYFDASEAGIVGLKIDAFEIEGVVR